MEFVDGLPLSEVLEKGPLSYEAVRSLQRRLAAGLQAAHELGVVHRDISPDNIILPGGDVTRAKIIDFGIARSATLGGATIIGGGFAGKYNYVSPEQLGLSGGDVTGKSDIYSMGLVLAEALTGRPIDMGGSQSTSSRSGAAPRPAAIVTHAPDRACCSLAEDRPGSIPRWPRGGPT
jgi:serine/threonine-protein kinase